MRSVCGSGDLESFMKTFKSLRKSLTPRALTFVVFELSAHTTDEGSRISIDTAKQIKQPIVMRRENRGLALQWADFMGGSH
jgi:hypothetical protein